MLRKLWQRCKFVGPTWIRGVIHVKRVWIYKVGPPKIGKVDLWWRFIGSSMDLPELFTNFHLGDSLCNYDLWFGIHIWQILKWGTVPPCSSLGWVYFWNGRRISAMGPGLAQILGSYTNFLIQTMPRSGFFWKIGHPKIWWFAEFPVIIGRIKKSCFPSSPMSHPKRSSRGRTPETTKILVFNLGIFVRFSGDLLSQITISRQRMLDTVQNIADAWPSDIYIYISSSLLLLSLLLLLLLLLLLFLLLF